MTQVYHISSNGTVEEFAAYSLPPKDALKAAYLQKVKNFNNTWDYDKMKVPIVDGAETYQILYGDNEVLAVRKDPIK